MVKYEFDKQHAFDFARSIHAQTKIHGDELKFKKCPYCKGGSGGKADEDTFDINLISGKFSCFRVTCGVAGNMITLSRDFDFSISDDLDRYYNRNDYNSKFKKFKKVEIESKDEAIKYMGKRGISAEVVCRYNLTTKKDQENILVFPFTDQDGELKFVKYRNMAPKQKGAKEWCEANCMPILFGMEQCDGFDRLVLTEGQIDSLSLAEAGIKNAVSVPIGAKGFTWVPHCWDWLIKFEELIIMGDCDKGAITLTEMKKRFPGKVRIVRVEDYKDCKDANEILLRYGKRALVHAIENAKEVDIKQVKDLADVESVNIYDMERIKTKIKEIDALLGGLFLGQLVLLTGKRGEGKSTFMSQLIVEAVQQEYKVFAYSGELMDWYFKRWIDLQVAGDKYVVEGKSHLGYMTYDIRRSHIDKINNWYRGKIKRYQTEYALDRVRKHKPESSHCPQAIRDYFGGFFQQQPRQAYYRNNEGPGQAHINN